MADKSGDKRSGSSAQASCTTQPNKSLSSLEKSYSINSYACDIDQNIRRSALNWGVIRKPAKLFYIPRKEEYSNGVLAVMKLKSRGGHIQDAEFHHTGRLMKNRFEQQNVLGPFKVGGGRYVAVTYFERLSYFNWLLRTGIIYIVSFFHSSFYFRVNSLATRVRGMFILDDDANPISDRELQLRVARVALPWIDVYLCPVFPPRMLVLVEKALKLNEEVYKQCLERKIPEPTTFATKLFFQKLREADRKVIRSHSTFSRLHSSMKNATNLFRQISDRPSEESIMRLNSVMNRVASNFDELADWCEERAESWPDFIDSYELFKKEEERMKHPVRRFGIKALWRALLAIAVYIASAGNFAFSTILSIISWLGIEGAKTLLSFRWQSKMLKKAARKHRRISNRAKLFLKLFDVPLEHKFLR